MPRNTLEFLEYAMSGATITPADIDELRGVPPSTRTDEDLHLDYKDGRNLNDRDRARATIREYVCAFANSDGGVLIFGLDATTLDVSPCVSQMGNTDIAEWINDCIGTLSAPLSPPHRIQKIHHPDGLIVVVTVPRTIGLVYCFVNNRRVYYLRRHDETFEAPEYLINDLLIGRRQQPRLEIVDFSSYVYISPNERSSSQQLSFQIGVTVENVSLAWAEDVRIGMIGWSERNAADSEPLSNQLRSYIDVENVDESILKQLLMIHQYQFNIGNLGTFDTFWHRAIYDIGLPNVHQFNWFYYDWEGVIYIIAKNTRPTWYQISIKPSRDIRAEIINNRSSDSLNLNTRAVHNGGIPLFSITPVTSGRARVAISNIVTINQ